MKEYNPSIFTNRISGGKETVVYDIGDEYVYKVCKQLISLEKLQEEVDKYNSLSISEHCEIVGYVVYSENKYWVLRQRKLKTFNDIIREYLESKGYRKIIDEWTNVPMYTNGETIIRDIHLKNWAYDGDQLKLIDGTFFK